MAIDFNSNWKPPTTQPEQVFGAAWKDANDFLNKPRSFSASVNVTAQQPVKKLDYNAISQELINDEAVRLAIAKKPDAFLKAYKGYDSFTESVWQGLRILVSDPPDKDGYMGGYDIAERLGIPSEQWRDMSDDDKKAAYQKDKAKTLQEEFPHPFTEVDRPGYTMLGQAASSLVDISTVFPGLGAAHTAKAGQLGALALKAGASSAVINTLDPIGQQAMGDLGITAKDYAFAVGAGAVGGAGVGYLGAKLALWQAGRQLKGIDDGIEQELQREMSKATKIREMLDDPEKLKELKINGELADTYKKLYDERIYAISNIDPVALRERNKLAARVTPETTAEDFMVNIFRNNLGFGELSDDEFIQMYRSIAPDQLEQYIKNSVSYERLPTPAKEHFDKLFEKYKKDSSDAVMRSKNEALKEAYVKHSSKTKSGRKTAKAKPVQASDSVELDDDLPFGKEGEFDFIDAALDESTPADELKQVFDAMDPAVQKSFMEDVIKEGAVRRDGEDAMDFLVRAVRDGNIARDSKIGDAIGDNVGFHTEPELHGKTGVFKWFDKGFGVENWAAKPGKFFSDYGGTYGKVLTTKLERADRMMREATGRATVMYKRAFYDNNLRIDGEDGIIVRRILNRSIDSTDSRVTSAHIDAANVVKKILDDNLRAAKQYGVLTDADYQKLVAKSNREGYFPRVWDTEYIRSKNGRDKFITKLQEVEYTEEQLRDYILAVTGNNKARTSFIKKYTTNKGGKYKLTLEGARYIQRRFGRNLGTSSGTSTHFEHSLKFPREMDEILDEFMLPNFDANMNSYLNDTARRLAHAAEFGPKDEKFSELLTLIRKDNPERVHMVDAMEEVYKLSVQSPDSKYIQRMMSASEGGKSAMRGMDSWQNLKLGLAQVLNVGQHMINGTTRVAATGGNPISVYRKAVGQVFTDMRQNKLGGGVWSGGDAAAVADRAGAAMELINMRVMSDIMDTPASKSGRGISLFNRTAAGNMTGISNWWLRTTQFERFEHANRVMGYYMGKVHIEDLLAKKKRAMGNPKKLEMINKYLRELGIDPNVHPSKVKIREIDEGANIFEQILNNGTKEIDEQAFKLSTNISEGALKFANDINFVNTPLTRPLLWNSPYASLFTKFKGFALNQLAFVKDNVIKPAYQRRNFKPLAMYFTAGLPFGLGINELRQTIRGDDRELSATENMLQAISTFGGLGIASDFVFQAASYREGLTRAIAGPILGDLDSMSRAIHDSGIYHLTELQEAEVDKIGKAFWKSFGPGKLATDILRIDIE